ncbi:iron ABC transporter permease [Bradyrhizobium barranii]|uniref:Iron ABC transporter permease n=2 Tax=Bradyrhizobium barranii TaxID=2992140 RepID=A0A7Z0QK03_9BRAD|nr:MULTISPECIES: iron ABC transporter permease [Bradyrhizobium]UFW83294.1 iron ABC transporter permease [Bradyrhizobium japonicum]UGX97814.1 iron ABC transporter permease [Bradyrhizobium barranii subsp. barranii]CUU18242.1 ABC Fe3 siderophore transporter inner membrane subunit CDS [Bradyrhizobium sp.]
MSLDASSALGSSVADALPKPLPGRDTVIQYGMALLTIVLIAAPLLPVLYQSFLDRALYDSGQQLTLGNFGRLLRTDGFALVIWNTFVFATLTTVISQTLGTLAAVLFGRTDMPFARLFGELFLWPIYLSALVLSFGWYTIYGPAGYLTLLVQSIFDGAPWNLYSLPGMAMIAGVSQAPVAYIYCMSSASITDPTLEEAARVTGAGTLRTLWRITLPLLMPAIAYSAVLNFTVGLELLAIPLVFGDPAGITVLTTFLYNNGVASARPDHGLVATAAALMLAVVCVLVWLQGRLLGNTRRFVTLGGKATRPRPFRLNNLRWPLCIVSAIYITATVVMPIGALLLRAFTSLLSPMVPISEVLTLGNFANMLEYPVYPRSIWNSLIVSSVGGVVATAMVALIAIIVLRSDFRWRGALHYIALFPRAVPGVVAGIGFFYAFALVPGLGGLRNTIWILVAAFTMHFIPVGLGAVAPMLLQMSPDFDRAARTQGADWWTTSRRIVLPLLRPALVACFIILFITFFKEYTTAIFLFAPGSEVIGTTLLQAWTQGEVGLVSALATIQILVIGVCVTAARAFLGVKLYG